MDRVEVEDNMDKYLDEEYLNEVDDVKLELGAEDSEKAVLFAKNMSFADMVEDDNIDEAMQLLSEIDDSK